MNKVRKAFQSAALSVVSLAMIFGFFASTKDKAFTLKASEEQTNLSYSTPYYTLSYSEATNEVKLVLDTDFKSYQDLSKSDLATLKDNVISIAKEVIFDDVDLDELLDEGSSPKTRKLSAKKVVDYVDTTNIENVIQSNLTTREQVDAVLDEDGSYDTLLSYYVDRYVASFVKAQETALGRSLTTVEKQGVYDKVKANITKAIKAAISAVYDADPEATTQEKQDALNKAETKTSEVVNDVKETNDNGNKVEITIDEVVDVINQIEDTSNVVKLIKDMDVQEEVKEMVKDASADEVSNFLSNVDMDTIVEVVKEVNLDKDDVKEILEDLGSENLVDLVNDIGMSDLEELAKAVDMTKDDVQDVIKNSVNDISLGLIGKIVSAVRVDNHSIYADSSLSYSGIVSVLKDLPRFAEIASYTDEEMTHTWNIALDTTFGTIDFDFTLAFDGDCSLIRKAASTLADAIDISKVDGTYVVDIKTPAKLDDLFLDFCNSTSIGDDVKLEIYNLLFSSVDEAYNTITTKELSEYIDLLQDVNYETLASNLINANKINSILGTNKITEDRIDKFVNGLAKIVDKVADYTYEDVKNFIKGYLDLSILDNATVEKIANKFFEFVQRVDAKSFDATTLRKLMDPNNEEITNSTIYNKLEKLANYEDRFDQVMEYLTKFYNKLPTRLQDNKLIDYYLGDGQGFNYTGTISLDIENILVKFLGDRGQKLYDAAETIFDHLPSEISVNVSIEAEDIYSITYHVDGEEITSMLPKGAEIGFFSNHSEVTTWLNAEGEEITVMPAADTDVYANFKVAVNDGDTALTKTYTGDAYTLTATCTPDTYAYTYQWYKDGEAISGATASTYDVTNVADSGDYYVEATALGYTNVSNTITVTIKPIEIDVSSLTWDYSSSYTYNTNNQKVELTSLPDHVVVDEYSNNEATKAGSYTASVTLVTDSDNYAIKGSVPTCDWVINKAKINVSDLTWNYSGSYTYDTNNQKVELSSLHDHVVVDEYSDNEAIYAGSYTANVTLTVDDPENYEIVGTVEPLTWVIDKAPIDVSDYKWNYQEAFTYNTQYFDVAVINTNPLVDISYSGKTSAKNAGSYTANATAQSNDANYVVVGEIDQLVWTINKAPIDASSFTWDYEDAFTYDGTSHEVALNFGEYKFIKATYTNNKAKNAGAYTATATLKANSNNYEIVGNVVPLTWTINKADLDVSDYTWNYESAFTYDGSRKTILLNSYDTDKLVANYENISAYDAGEYLAKVSFKFKDAVTANNYNLVGNVADCAWTIEKAEIDVSSLTWNYTEAYTYNGNEFGVKLVDLPENVTVTYANEKATDAGKYLASATIESASANYEVVGQVDDCSWEIAKAIIDVSDLKWDYADGQFTYNGNEFEVTLDGTIFHAKATYTGNKATVVGSYTASVTFEADDNYEIKGSVSNLNWTIDPAKIDVSGLTWNYSEPFTYSASEHTVSLKDVPSNLTINYIGNAATEVGVYTAKATAVASENYEVVGTINDLTWEIKAYVEPEPDVDYQRKSSDGKVTIDAVDGIDKDLEMTVSSSTDYSGIDFSSVLGDKQEISGGEIFDIVFAQGGQVDHLEDGSYKVTLLIPENLREKDNDHLLVVYIDDNNKISGGKIDFTRNGDYVTFNATHFSKYAIFGIDDVKANLTWLWILIALLVIIIALLVFFLVRRNKKEELVAEVANNDVIEVYKDSGKIFVNGEEIKAENDVVAVDKNTGKVFVNGEEIIRVTVDKNSGDVVVNGKETTRYEVDKETGTVVANGKETTRYEVDKENGDVKENGEEVK